MKPASPFDYLGLGFRRQHVQLFRRDLSLGGQWEQNKQADYFLKHQLILGCM